MFSNNKISPATSNDVDLSSDIEEESADVEIYTTGKHFQWTPHLTERLRRRTEHGSLIFARNIARSKEILLQIKRFLKEAILKLEPWENPIKVIEGHHGSGVASYFLFLRWSVYLNLWFFLLILAFVVIPQVGFKKKDYNLGVLGVNVSFVHPNLSQYCSDLYVINHTSHNFKETLMELLKGRGSLEKTPLFYGYYDAKELSTSPVYAIPSAYLFVCVTCLISTVLLMTKKSSAGLQDSISQAMPSSHYHFFIMILLGWDYTMTDPVSAKLKLKSLKKQIISELADKKHRLKQMNMTNKQYAKIVSIRVLVNLFVLVCLGSGAYLIYEITEYTLLHVREGDYEHEHMAIRVFLEYLPSIVISLLNGIIPVLFSIITIVEDYLPQNEVMILLVRTILLRLGSLIFLIASLYKEVMCKPKDICNVGIKSCPSLRCWETYIGQQFYKLVIMDLMFTGLLCLVIEPIVAFLSKCLKIKFFKLEFNVSQCVLDLVYSLSLSWLGFFFAPLLPLMVLLKLFCTFYLKMLSALKWCTPFERPYMASKSQSLFATVLMFSFFLCCLPIGYTIYYIPPSRSCGPFRIYDHMHETFSVTVNQWPLSARVIIHFFSSGAFALTLTVLLAIFLYHCSLRSIAQNNAMKLLRQHLNTERKEKFYYMVETNKLTDALEEAKRARASLHTPKSKAKNPKNTSQPAAKRPYYNSTSH